MMCNFDVARLLLYVIDSRQVTSSVLGCVVRCLELNNSQPVECEYDTNLIMTQSKKAKQQTQAKKGIINNL
jgi:hypothetical protein